MKKIIFIIVAFLIIGGLIIYQSNNISFENKEGRKVFLSEYLKWIFTVGKSAKDTVGYAIKQDWLPEANATNSTAE